MPVHRLELSIEARQSLRSQLGALKKGNRRDFTTPLIPSEFEDDKDLGRCTMAQSLWDYADLGADATDLFEGAKRAGHGSFSRTPGYEFDSTCGDSLEKQIRRYVDPRPGASLNDDAIRYADSCVRSLYDVMAKGRISPISLLQAATSEFAGNTSGLGFPVFSSNREKYLCDVYNIAEEIQYDGWDIRWVNELPGLAGMRGQPRGPDQFAKARFIFQAPRALTICEKMVQAVIFTALRSHPWFCAWNGAASVATEMTKLFDERRDILSLDFKKFDASVRPFVIDRIIGILSTWMTPESGGILDLCREILNHMGVIVPVSHLNPLGIYGGEERTGGIPSGSCLTNLIGSLVNLWVMHYAAHRSGLRVKRAMVNGDDGVYTFNRGGDYTNELSYWLLSDLGMVISTEKTLPMSKDRVHFLQDVHRIDYRINGVCVGVRPLMHLSNAMWSYENISAPDWRRPMDSARWAMQLSMANYHPKFTQACEWLRAHDPVLDTVIDYSVSDPGYFARIAKAVGKKDSNSFWGCSPAQIASCPVFEYLTSVRS
jgi:hypothetical protein